MVRELDGLERLMYCCLCLSVCGGPGRLSDGTGAGRSGAADVLLSCLSVCGGPGRLSDGTGAGRSGAADVLLSLSVSVRRTRTSVGWYGELDGLERLMYYCLCLSVCGGPGRLSDGTGAGRSGAADQDAAAAGRQGGPGHHHLGHRCPLEVRRGSQKYQEAEQSRDC